MSLLDGLRPETTWPNHGVPGPLRGMEGEGLFCFGLYIQPVQRDPLRVIASVDQYGGEDGHWLHLSISRAKRLPSWECLVTARDGLGYAEWPFVQILAPRSAWLNLHNYTMHLQARLDRDTVPRVLWDQQGADGSRYGMHR